MDKLPAYIVVALSFTVIYKAGPGAGAPSGFPELSVSISAQTIETPIGTLWVNGENSPNE